MLQDLLERSMFNPTPGILFCFVGFCCWWSHFMSYMHYTSNFNCSLKWKWLYIFKKKKIPLVSECQRYVSKVRSNEFDKSNSQFYILFQCLNKNYCNLFTLIGWFHFAIRCDVKHVLHKQLVLSPQKWKIFNFPKNFNLWQDVSKESI